MSNYVTGRLGYNADNQRYGLLVTDLWEHIGFHCGESLEVQLPDSDKWVATRMEMNNQLQWYLAGTPYIGDLEYVKARLERA
jgi:hypothetical protein